MAASSKNTKSKTKITRKGQGKLARLAKSKGVITAAKLVGYGGALGILGGCAFGTATVAYRAIAG